MASYELKGSYSTVQVLGPSLINDVVYCTIETIPSGVIASMPVDQSAFDGGTAGTLLDGFAQAIELVMQQGEAVAGQGQQTIDQSGLLQDVVTFTVEYTPPGAGATSITAQADVPVPLLSTVETIGGQTTIADAEAIVHAVYLNLENLAGG